MLVRILKNSSGENILLLRNDIPLNEIPKESMLLGCELIDNQEKIMESQLFYLGVNISKAIPDLIEKGFFFLNKT